MANYGNTLDPNIEIGSRYSVCRLCAEEQLRANRKDPNNLRNSYDLVAKGMYGQFEGQPMLKLNVQGGPHLICMNHLKHYLAEFESIGKKNEKDT